jgi:hypothetical protein
MVVDHLGTRTSHLYFWGVGMARIRLDTSLKAGRCTRILGLDCTRAARARTQNTFGMGAAPDRCEREPPAVRLEPQTSAQSRRDASIAAGAIDLLDFAETRWSALKKWLNAPRDYAGTRPQRDAQALDACAMRAGIAITAAATRGAQQNNAKRSIASLTPAKCAHGHQRVDFVASEAEQEVAIHSVIMLQMPDHRRGAERPLKGRLIL